MRTRGVTRRGSDQGKHDQAERVEFPFAPSERVRWRSNQLQWRAEKREALALLRVLWDVIRWIVGAQSIERLDGSDEVASLRTQVYQGKQQVGPATPQCLAAWRRPFRIEFFLQIDPAVE